MKSNAGKPGAVKGIRMKAMEQKQCNKKQCNKVNAVKGSEKKAVKQKQCETKQESRKADQGLSKKGHGADALALGAEERRDKLRKAAGRSKYPVIRGYLNGGTHTERLRVSACEQNSMRRGTRRTETSK